MMGLSVYIALAAVLGAGLVLYILARVARGSEGLGFRLGFILFLAIGIACGAVIAVGLMLPSSAPPLSKLPWVVPIVLLALFTMYFAGSAITERSSEGSWLLLCVALIGLAILAYLILALLEIPIPLHSQGTLVWHLILVGLAISFGVGTAIGVYFLLKTPSLGNLVFVLVCFTATAWMILALLDWHWILVGLAISFGVWTAGGVYFLLKTPSWGHLLFVLLCFTATAWMILALLEIPIPMPWYMIVFGVGGTAYFIYLWKHRYDPNVSISIGQNEVPTGLRELVVLIGIAWFVTMTWFGIGGLSDPKYVQTWMHIYSEAEKIRRSIPAVIIGSILSVILFALTGPKSGNSR